MRSVARPRNVTNTPISLAELLPGAQASVSGLCRDRIDGPSSIDWRSSAFCPADPWKSFRRVRAGANRWQCASAKRCSRCVWSSPLCPDRTRCRAEPGAGVSPALHALPRITLVGNPNCGKTALFNLLTGARESVAKYAGATVERKEGVARLRDVEALQVIELPGTYSLTPATADEQMTLGVIHGRREDESAPELIVAVVDAIYLRINLRLVLELVRRGQPIVLALNRADEVRVGSASTGQPVEATGLPGDADRGRHARQPRRVAGPVAAHASGAARRRRNAARHPAPPTASLGAVSPGPGDADPGDRSPRRAISSLRRRRMPCGHAPSSRASTAGRCTRSGSW